MQDNSRAILIHPDKAASILPQLPLMDYMAAKAHPIHSCGELIGYGIKIRGVPMTNDEIEPYL